MFLPRLSGITFTALLLSSAALAQQPSTPGDPTVAGLVKVADEIKLPAMEPGVLVQLAVQEGALVRAGQVIGKIDDSEPQMQKKAANAAYAAAYKRWKDDVEIRFAQTQAEAYKAEYDMLVEANKIREKAITESELRKARLDWKHYEMAIEKSTHDQELAKYEAFTKQADVDAADLKIKRRVVVAPFDGVVEEIKRHQSEWVQPGDTILTLLKLDTMHVEGAVEQSKYDPSEIANCGVTIDVEMSGGQKATFQGRIIKVSSIVRPDGVYNVRAEIANQQKNSNWQLRDGMPATMTIHLGTANNPGVSRAR
ncbi:MAG: HlyD family efflux transporter periplasmic adaptor subunit [Pirellulales bacterium]